MKKEEIKTNYHSSLKEFSGVFDPIMVQLRDNYVDTKNRSFIPVLMMKPFTDIKKWINIFRNLSMINLSAIPFIGSTLLAAGIWGFFEQYNVLLLWIIGYLVLYILVLPIYLVQMTTPLHSSFHINAYRVFRKREYELFNKAFLREDFTFRGLYDLVTELLVVNEYERIKGTIDSLIVHFNAEKGQYQERIKELQKQREEENESDKVLLKEGDELILDLSYGQEKLELVIRHLVDLIKQTNNTLYRMTNGLFKPSDLKILSAFTLYELKDDQLFKIMDEGTSGSSPDQLQIDEEKYNDWACVQVVLQDSEKPLYNNPYPGHTVVSYRMKMGEGKYWVYNFHIDENSNEKALELTISDIIDSRVVFRLVHALCLLLHDQGFPKEGLKDVDRRSS